MSVATITARMGTILEEERADFPQIKIRGAFVIAEQLSLTIDVYRIGIQDVHDTAWQQFSEAMWVQCTEPDILLRRAVRDILHALSAEHTYRAESRRQIFGGTR